VRGMNRPTAVLVHGGFHGGWCWRKVTASLVAAGWNVYTPTLTGVGERAHLATPGVGLETHITDVTGLIECEELHDIVLCGHSAGGMVVSAVADRLAHRILHVIYLDSVVPHSGESFFDALGEDSGMPQVLRDQAVEGAGWLVSPSPLFTAASFGVLDATDAAWVNRRLTCHPLAAFADRVTLTDAIDLLPKTYVRATRLPIAALDQRASSLEGQRRWEVERWDGGHDLMITDAGRVLELMQRVAS
jgi:pimeloyl-ACP methyl ester carboxylesterase